MTAATYGGLLWDASRHMGEGCRLVRLDRFADKIEADLAVAAYYGLLDAASQHVWALISPARMAGVAASEHPHPIEATALVMANVLQVGPDDLPPHPSVIAPDRHPWDYASRVLRAASDLVASHVTITGGAHTPDAPLVWDEQARNGALARMGEFVAQLTATQDMLGLRAGQAGVRWEKVGRWLPPADRTQAAALAVVRVAQVMGVIATELDSLTAASARVHGGTQIDRLGDLVARIRRTAWDLREHPDYSVQTLADTARVGFEVAVHTATFHGVDLHDPAVAARDPGARRAATWLALMADLRGYLGAGPADRRVRADATALHDLLGDLVPRDRLAGDRGASARPEERRLGGALHGACAAFEQAAEWNAAAFARLARSEQVYVPIDSLTGDQLSDRPELAAARLTHSTRLVPAPAERTEATLDRYRDVAHLSAVPHLERTQALPTSHMPSRHDDTIPAIGLEPTR
ncbi:hypothetical protein [Cellulomonas soli]|uniref:Uncharacterized protein n=1 Tax=Cellulomonas soli TaxID=931535 RepID=A0A512P9B6_9CELL|nr:hypothetical protein [Cellulomonas soli]NYI60274.1 hypothetical protein [Cellulomonas soli]GEP67786.1 hypothetical protein CSO01_05010 [Cellulomonas soli]